MLRSPGTYRSSAQPIHRGQELLKDDRSPSGETKGYICEGTESFLCPEEVAGAQTVIKESMAPLNTEEGRYL